MYFPSTRLLNILDLLRANGQMSARDLATELEVDARTVRRYMVMLDDLGMPVETVRGRYGGYRLRPGYKLPPIVFSDDEVLALTMGLIFARQMGLTGMIRTADLAIAKMERAMPADLAAQAKMLNETLVMETPPPSWPAPTELILSLSAAAHSRKRIWMRYGTNEGVQTERHVDLYGLVFTIGLWYITGYCHLRQNLRIFRIDRIQELTVGNEEFVPPEEFDALAHVQDAIARTPGLWLVEVILQTTLGDAKKVIPPGSVILEEHVDGILLKGYTENLEKFAHFLLGLPFAMTILAPNALHDELHALSARAIHLTENLTTEVA